MTHHNAADLATRHCEPCEGGVRAFSVEEARQQLQELPQWRLTHDGRRIRRDWQAKDFEKAMEFMGRVAQLAELEGHHPDLHLESYRKVWIELSTHAIGGLSENDFILAAKIDLLPIETKD
jgi:4a-hydroxytetrahydrobiopterin dehydratase